MIWLYFYVRVCRISAVTGKTTAEEALKEVDQNPEDYFHIVMTDVHMSGMDGFDLLHRINGRVPVIS